MDWNDDTGKSLSFEVNRKRRSRVRRKALQIDSIGYKNQTIFSFPEAEKRRKMDQISEFQKSPLPR